MRRRWLSFLDMGKDKFARTDCVCWTRHSSVSTYGPISQMEVPMPTWSTSRVTCCDLKTPPCSKGRGGSPGPLLKEGLLRLFLVKQLS